MELSLELERTREDLREARAAREMDGQELEQVNADLRSTLADNEEEKRRLLDKAILLQNQILLDDANSKAALRRTKITGTLSLCGFVLLATGFPLTCSMLFGFLDGTFPLATG